MRELEGRAQRLAIQIEKTQKQLAGLEPGGVMGRLFAPKARLQEYERKSVKLKQLRNSLQNIKDYGLENLPTGNPVGVNVGVPLSGTEN